MKQFTDFDFWLMVMIVSIVPGFMCGTIGRVLGIEALTLMGVGFLFVCVISLLIAATKITKAL